MATTLQNNHVQSQQEDEDITIANYLSTTLRFDQSQDLWSYPQPVNYVTNPYYLQHLPYQQQSRPPNGRSRTASAVITHGTQPSNSAVVQKSLSTPISTRSRKSHHQLTRPQFNTNNNNMNINPNYNSSNASVSSSSSNQTKNNSKKGDLSDYVSPSKFSNNSSNNGIYGNRPKSSQITKTSSTPVPDAKRRSVNSTIALSSNDIYQHHRPSTSSIISSSAISNQSVLSIQSSVSYQSTLSNQSLAPLNTKPSFSKRLRKVFSMNTLKTKDLASLRDKNGSNVSIDSTVTDIQSTVSTSSLKQDRQNPLSFRRRSIASLSSLFHKDSSTVRLVPPPPQMNVNTSQSTARRHSSGDLRQLTKEDKKKKPELVVNTEISGQTPPVRKGVLKTRSSSNGVTPDSPNSAISSRSFSRLPPPQQQIPQRALYYNDAGLPSPTPSSSSSSNNNRKMTPEDIENELLKMTPTIGLHYGIGLHSSPKLKPASSSTSSLGGAMPERRIQFCSTIQVHETFSSGDYDRRCDSHATCQKLTPMVAMKIKQELNEYKLTDMKVHVESRQYTHFFL
ncbi:hypothetical protein BDB01DRAFT_848201 [Pilobolus umbonatus]|nr:hypothetical protein BDB01DRAFT_848201 [Pilobolus umbonatus]